MRYMKSFKKRFSLFGAAVLFSFINILQVSAEAPSKIDIFIDTSSDKKLISPYIYGINESADLSGLKVTSIKQGSSRFSTYNWETNFSNAGSDWFNTNDNALVSRYTLKEQKAPGLAVDSLINTAVQYKIPYAVTTIPMCGYAAADANGPVLSEQNAPSSRWIPFIFKKSEPFSLTPDLTDNAVYADEYINFILNKYGKADSSSGIRGYALDNNTGEWSLKQPSAHPGENTIEEFLNKSIQLSKVIKGLDEKALVFGGQLKNIDSYYNFNAAKDWSEYSANSNWFIDCYLSEMKKSSQSYGKRLVDVLDLYYYSEDTAVSDTLNVTECTNNSHEDCNFQRMQAPRTLWDSTYTENSRIGSEFKQYTPLIPTVQASINKYFSGTKLAFSEYNFGGGNHISGAIAEADTLGIFGREGVYFASLNPSEGDISYQKAAINLFTDFDGNGTGFGNTSINAKTSDISMNSVYASLDNADEAVLKIILINKNPDSRQTANISINSGVLYNFGNVYAISPQSSKIQKKNDIKNIKDNKFTYTLEPMSIYEIILTTDGSISHTTTDSAAYYESASKENNNSDISATSSQILTDNTEKTTDYSEITSLSNDNTQTSVNVINPDDPFGENVKSVPLLLKVVVIVLISLTFVGIAYLLFVELKLKK